MKKIFYTLALLGIATVAFATHGGGNVNPNNVNSERHAWSDVAGWIDFDASAITVTNSKVSGNANGLQIGELALDCAASPNGNICGGPGGNWFVSNDSNGNLAGWGWNDSVGWVSFCGNASGGSTFGGGTWSCPGAPIYQVTISTSNGNFSGWAWNDVVGWISFNCNNTGIGNQCPSSDYKVKTSWTGGPPLPPPGTTYLISSTFDTQVAGGAAFNSILWQGVQPAGTSVRFQIASSNISTGPWNYIGHDGTNITFYDPGGPNKQVRISRVHHNNKQYVRYKIFMEPAGVSGPRVDDVIISYSP